MSKLRKRAKRDKRRRWRAYWAKHIAFKVRWYFRGQLCIPAPGKFVAVSNIEAPASHSDGALAARSGDAASDLVAYSSTGGSIA